MALLIVKFADPCFVSYFVFPFIIFSVLFQQASSVQSNTLLKSAPTLKPSAAAATKEETPA